MDDSAIGGSETDSSYDDVDALSPRESGSSAAESSGYLSTSTTIAASNLSEFDMKLRSCDSRLGFLETQLKSSKGSHMVAMKEMEQVKSLIDQLSSKIKVHCT